MSDEQHSEVAKYPFPHIQQGYTRNGIIRPQSKTAEVSRRLRNQRAADWDAFIDSQLGKFAGPMRCCSCASSVAAASRWCCMCR